MKNSLVFVFGGEVFTDSLRISKELGMDHRKILDNIEKVKSTLLRVTTSCVFRKDTFNSQGREFPKSGEFVKTAVQRGVFL